LQEYRPLEAVERVDARENGPVEHGDERLPLFGPDGMDDEASGMGYLGALFQRLSGIQRRVEGKLAAPEREVVRHAAQLALVGDEDDDAGADLALRTRSAGRPSQSRSNQG
jgi:hypothetical protein